MNEVWTETLQARAGGPTIGQPDDGSRVTIHEQAAVQQAAESRASAVRRQQSAGAEVKHGPDKTLERWHRIQWRGHFVDLPVDEESSVALH